MTWVVAGLSVLAWGAVVYWLVRWDKKHLQAIAELRTSRAGTEVIDPPKCTCISMMRHVRVEGQEQRVEGPMMHILFVDEHFSSEARAKVIDALDEPLMELFGPRFDD